MSNERENADVYAVNTRLSAPERLIRLRDRLGLTQREMARDFGVSAAAINLWESQQRPVPGPVLRLLDVYEEQLANQDPAQVETWSFDWLKRALPTLGAAALFVGMSRFGSAETAVGRRVRDAAVRRFVRLVGQRKGLSMKLAQLVDYITPLMPEADQDAFATFSSEQRTIAPSKVAELVYEQLGKPIRQLFADFDTEPFALGSIGQVHRACLSSGERVVVKVQYPWVKGALLSDMQGVGVFDELWCTVFRGQKRGVFFHELRTRFLQECDYVAEARAQESFRTAFKADADVVVPKTFPALSSGSILTSEQHMGQPLHVFLRRATGAEKARAANALWRFHWQAIFQHGLFHTDPNPANVLFGDHRIVMLDFGRTRTYSPEFLWFWKNDLRAALERDSVALAKNYDVVASAGPQVDIPAAMRYALAFYRPFLLDEPFVYTQGYLRMLWSSFGPKNPNAARISYSAEMVLWNQLTFGLPSVLAQLGAPVEGRKHILSWLYPDGNAPPAFTRAELRAIDPALEL